jgi:hypothetical protein
MPGHNSWVNTNLELGSDTQNLPFKIELVIPAVLGTNFEQASDTTARLIANTFDNLYLCLSGGMDSEYVASVLIRNKIPFVPVLLKTNGNLGEIWYANHFCTRHNLTPLVIDYTNNDNALLRLMFKYSNAASINNSISFFPHVIADYIESYGGSLITGYGEPFCNSNDYTVVTDDQLEIEEHDFYLDLNFGAKHPGGFLSYTPDMFFSLVTHMPIGVNIQVAKEILYQIPGRSKITSLLEFPTYVPDKVKKLKAPNLRCIKCSRTDLLTLAQTKSIIKLSSI